MIDSSIELSIFRTMYTYRLSDRRIFVSIKISNVKGVGPKAEESLNKLGIITTTDLLNYYPRDYDLYQAPVLINQIEEGRVAAVVGTIVGNVTTVNRRIQITTLHIRDESGIIKATWFRSPYLQKSLKTGMVVVLRGCVRIKGQELNMEQPEIFNSIADYNNKVDTLQPRYTLTKGLTNNAMTKAVKQVFMEFGIQQNEVFDDEFLGRYKLCTKKDAIKGMHFPKDKSEYIDARRRVVFDEFMAFIMTLRSMKEDSVIETNKCVLESSPGKCITEKIMEQLPYNLTSAQMKVWDEIKKDVVNPQKVMSRLVQGDVGSGKTIVALLGLLLAVANGYQGAMMAPTEVLAKQHFLSIHEMLKQHNLDFRVELLTGSMTAKEKRESYRRIESGEAQIIVGTHALIQDKVNYHNLGMVITDEQHRFGVRQRELFSKKGINPHVLVMSATPIPRTLAIILYGDLDISIIDELPSNRLPIKNCVVGTDYQPTAYNFMKKQILEGRQCYVICPMVEESEHMEGANVIDYAKQLQDKLGSEVNVSFLHGKMKQAEKDAIMGEYNVGNINVLVSTTVIEVGINVPNATVMLIENAERFGLSGLHQLRGRVGRGAYQSYCIFMTGSKSKDTKERLGILAESNDGFKVANEDLRLRGPGDLFGVRQSGLMNFKVADIYQDAQTLQLVSEAVSTISGEQKLKLEASFDLGRDVVL